MKDYIPSSDADKVLWLTEFSVWLDTHGATYGFTPAQLAAFDVEVAGAKGSLNGQLAAQTASRAATATKKAAFTKAIAKARSYAQRLQHDLNMTNAERAAAGLPQPDTIKTDASSEAISELQPPLLLLDFSIRHQVTIHWGHNPGDERHNGKPAFIMGCEIQYAKGSLPLEESGWTTLGLATDSPMIHHVPGMVPATYLYRARYVDKKLRYGNFGDPAECTVSV